jgi:hypothetical protein
MVIDSWLSRPLEGGLVGGAPSLFFATATTRKNVGMSEWLRERVSNLPLVGPVGHALGELFSLVSHCLFDVGFRLVFLLVKRCVGS